MGHLHGPVVGGVVQVDQRVKFRKEVQSGLFYPWGNVWYADGDNGNAGYSGRGPSDAKVKPSEAIAAATDNDFIYLKAADYTETASIVLSLNDVQIVGIAPNPHQPHLDIWQSGAYTPMLEVSGRGNVLANMTFRHGTAAEDVVGALISGRYNTFENVYFYTPQVAAQDVAAYRGVRINGHNNYFHNCKFGADGIARDGENYNVTIEGVGNVFEDCIFQITIDGTAPHFLGFCIDYARDCRVTTFKNCTFIAYSADWGVALAEAIGIGTSIAGGLYFDPHCQFINVTKVCATATGTFVWMSSPGEAAATAFTGKAVRQIGE